MKTHGQILYENEKSINWAQSLVGWYILLNRIEFQCEFEGRDEEKIEKEIEKYARKNLKHKHLKGIDFSFSVSIFLFFYYFYSQYIDIQTTCLQIL